MFKGAKVLRQSLEVLAPTRKRAISYLGFGISLADFSDISTTVGDSINLNHEN